MDSSHELEWIDPFAWSDRRPGRLVSVAAATVLILGLGGIAALQSAGGHGVVMAPAANPTESAGSLSSANTATSAVVDLPTTVVSTTTAPHVLPIGGMSLGGQVPLCNELSSDTYRCSLSNPYDASMPEALNEVGLTAWYLNDLAVVAGGCRTTTANSREWLCYVGQRAVDEGIISGALLGTRQAPGFVSG